MPEDEGTGARILAVATDMLADEGYGSLSMRHLAAKLGLSQAAIYRHYRNKADLVSKIVEIGYAELLARVIPAGEVKAEELESLMAASMRAYVQFALEKPRLFKAVLLEDLGEAGQAVEAFGPGVSLRRRSFAYLAESLAAGMAAGRFAVADPELTAQAIWAAMFGLAARLAIESGGKGGRREEGSETARDERRAALVEREIEIILRGLRA